MAAKEHKGRERMGMGIMGSGKYDYANRLIQKTLDSDGDGTADSSIVSAYDGKAHSIERLAAKLAKETTASRHR